MSFTYPQARPLLNVGMFIWRYNEAQNVIEFVTCREEGSSVRILPQRVLEAESEVSFGETPVDAAIKTIHQNTSIAMPDEARLHLFAAESDTFDDSGQAITLLFACHVGGYGTLAKRWQDSPLQSRVEGETAEWTDLTKEIFSAMPDDMGVLQKAVEYLSHYGSEKVKKAVQFV